MAGKPAPSSAASSFTDVDSSRYYYKAVLWAVEQGVTMGTSATSFSPGDTVSRLGLVDIRSAYRGIHAPADMAEAAKARERLVFEELFVLACALGSMKQRRREEAGFRIPDPGLASFARLLPFTLTGAQERAIREAFSDMASGAAMNRLVQGDVGSGKTMVAAACIWAVPLFTPTSTVRCVRIPAHSIVVIMHRGRTSLMQAFITATPNIASR